MSTEAPEATTTAPAVELDDLAVWLQGYEQAQAKIKELEQVAKTCRAQIEARLGAAEAGTVAGRVAVRWTVVQSSRIDVKKLRAEYPDLAEAVTVPSISRRFTLVEGDES